MVLSKWLSVLSKDLQFEGATCPGETSWIASQPYVENVLWGPHHGAVQEDCTPAITIGGLVNRREPPISLKMLTWEGLAETLCISQCDCSPAAPVNCATGSESPKTPAENGHPMRGPFWVKNAWEISFGHVLQSFSNLPPLFPCLSLSFSVFLLEEARLTSQEPCMLFGRKLYA